MCPCPSATGVRLDPTKAARRHRRPSLPFAGIVAAFAASGWLAWTEVGTWSVFAFVLSGWVVSLCLHEYAHAAAAYAGGDRSVADKGYLTLDPRHYTDPGLSLLIPLLFVVLGGIGLPGGAVWINRRALRSPAIESLVSFAGPAANTVLAALCLLPLGLGWIELDVQSLDFASGLALLGFLQVTAVVLNLLPVPGLDGYGALEPWLPQHLSHQLAPLRRWGPFAVLLMLCLPGPSQAFFGNIDQVLQWTGVDPELSNNGLALFRFWEP